MPNFTSPKLESLELYANAFTGTISSSFGEMGKTSKHEMKFPVLLLFVDFF